MAEKKLKSSSPSTKPPPLQLEEEEEDSSPDNKQQQHSSASSYGGVGVYDPTKTPPRWTLFDTHCPYRYFGNENFAVEYNGDLYVLNTLDDRDPVVRRRRGRNKLGFVKTDNEGEGSLAVCIHTLWMILLQREETLLSVFQSCEEEEEEGEYAL